MIDGRSSGNRCDECVSISVNKLHHFNMQGMNNHITQLILSLAVKTEPLLSFLLENLMDLFPIKLSRRKFNNGSVLTAKLSG